MREGVLSALTNSLGFTEPVRWFEVEENAKDALTKIGNETEFRYVRAFHGTDRFCLECAVCVCVRGGLCFCACCFSAA